MPKGDKLTPKQKKFCQEYLIDLNATQAAIRAGYSKKTTGIIGFENLRKPKIKKVIEAAQQKAADKAEVTKERILREEVRLAFADPRQLCDGNGITIPLHKLPDDIARAIVGLEVIIQADGSPKYKYKFSDKGKSLERLSRHLGLFEKDAQQLAVIILGPDNTVNKSPQSGIGEDG